jgi:crotonobetainyl-CoA:carnitine CoA-transferase CaiB-like acyl-CoA transferase
MGALQGLRVVELAEHVSGEYCGRLLAALGADVVKIEPLAGSKTRQLAPFATSSSDVDNVERSAFSAYLNAGKQSVCVDIESSPEIVHALLENADIVIDDHEPGWLGALNLSPETRGTHYPELVVCSITPFGYTAPPAATTELTIFHASGWGYHTPSGANADLPPLSGAGRFMVAYEAGIDAALTAAAAAVARNQHLEGQFIDISMQAVMVSRNDYVVAQMVAGELPVGDDRHAFDLAGPAGIFACATGFVYIWMSSPQHWQALGELMDHPSWMEDFPPRWLELECTAERVAECRKHLGAWLAQKEPNGVSASAQHLGLTMVPVNAPADLIESEQYAFRQFFTAIDHPALTTTYAPGEPFRLSKTPVSQKRVAPRLGAHNERLRTPWSPRDIDKPCARTQQGPLAGVRVVELTKVWAGPYVGKQLTLLGAEVIRIESESSLDVTRVFGVADLNNAPGFKAVNAQKLSVQIDMKTERGIALIHDLVQSADIVVENLRPGAIDRLGLGFDALIQMNPRLVYVAMSMWGNEGPLAYQTGYAPCFAALGGVSARVGYGGEAPAGMNVRYADSTFGAYTTLAALAALRHSRLTGEGQYVDVAAVEAMSAMIGDAFVEHIVKDEVSPVAASRRIDMAPHGVWRCADGQWLALSVADELQWQALVTLMGQSQLADDARFQTLALRKEHEDALDDIVAEYCTQHSADDLEQSLQRHGVAAIRSRHSLDLISDSQLWAHGLFIEVSDTTGQSQATMGPPWRLEHGAEMTRAAPRLGQHNDYVLQDILGLSAAEQAALTKAGVIR